jgi:putative ATP-dependent endonuclease of the OLD family
MKINKLSIVNVTSYKNRTEFVFDARINILIGPNGGGKSNLQKILALVLSKYFILQYDFRFSDEERKIEPIDLWNRRTLERSLERFMGDSGDQEIEIVLTAEQSDIDNIKTIGGNLDRFNEHLSEYEHPYKSYPPLEHVEAIAGSPSLKYRIRNLSLEDPVAGTAEWAFLAYLRDFFIFMRLASRIPDIKLTSPIFFFFSERTFGKKLEVQSNQITEQNYFAGFRSASQAAMGDNTNLLQWGAQHFARLHWKAVNRAAVVKDKTAADFFKLEPDVQLLNRYMKQLGYEWDFLTDHDSVSFAFALRKDSHWLTVDKFSSGEKEIVHFLLALFALNVKDGVVLVDEPELHLHPRWQRIFLGLFRELAPERNNQFLISTHSPVFVTPDTINNITRIYRRLRTGSTRIALRDVALPDKKNLVRMINSQNNERVFFADKVVLVEGITDRLVFASLLDALSARYSNNEAIEIVEVGGKNSFSDYRSLLRALETPSVVVADLDYLTIVGSATVRRLFGADTQKQWETLTKDKKSIDGATMMRALVAAVELDDKVKLSEFLAYFRSRHRRLKQPLTASEAQDVVAERIRLEADDIFILANGEIEQYLPPDVSDVKGVVAMTTNRNWINQVADSSRRVELGRIVCSILGVPLEEWHVLQTELTSGKVRFPQPVSERLADQRVTDEVRA